MCIGNNMESWHDVPGVYFAAEIRRMARGLLRMPVPVQSPGAMEEELEGFRVVAATLAKLGVTHMFGVVGIPVVEVEAIMMIRMISNHLNHHCLH